MSLIRSPKVRARSTVRSVDPSLTTVMSTAVTGPWPMMAGRAARQRSMMLTMLSSSLSAGMAMSSFIDLPSRSDLPVCPGAGGHPRRSARLLLIGLFRLLDLFALLAAHRLQERGGGVRALAAAPKDHADLPAQSDLGHRQRHQLAALDLQLGAPARQQGDAHLQANGALDAFQTGQRN